MDIKINQKTEEPLLSRTRFQATVTFTGATPSAKDLGEALCKQTKNDAKLVQVRTINTKFGKTIASMDAYIYENKDAMHSIEGIGEAEEEAKPEAKENKEEAKKETPEQSKEAPKEEKAEKDA